MRVTESGAGLHAVISCEFTIHNDWQSYACWYSLKKWLPDIEITVLCTRDYEGGYAPFTWPTRARTQFFQHKRFSNNEEENRLCANILAVSTQLVKPPFISLTSTKMCVRSLSGRIIDAFEQHRCVETDGVWYFRDIAVHTPDYLKSTLNTSVQVDELANKANEFTSSTFSDFSEVEKFNLSSWKTSKLTPPFSISNSIVTPEASPNARKILAMWSRLGETYEVMR